MKWRPNPKAFAAALTVAGLAALAKMAGSNLDTTMLVFIAFVLVYKDMREKQ